jgi:hypothetical protein
MKKFVLALLLIFTVTSVSFGEGLIDRLQKMSVTVKSGGGQGSGVLFTREIEGKNVTFVWTAAHVVDNLRRTRPIVDPKTGSTKLVIEFEDAAIVQEFKSEGRRTGETKMDARVVRYSNADNGEDLALLQVREKNFYPADNSATFYLDDEIPEIGTELYHVGSLLGQIGANSLTTGIISQVGRVVNVGSDTVFDQTTATAFPGSSGGGVFLKGDGRYVGMLVRGAGEGFNLIVPARRLRCWAKDAGVEWAIDPNVPTPSLKEINNLTVEDSGVDFDKSGNNNAAKKEFPFLFKVDLPKDNYLKDLIDAREIISTIYPQPTFINN